MADFRPIFVSILLIALVGLFLNVFIAPHVESEVMTESTLSGFVDFLENGWEVSITIPIFGEVSTTINPVSWLWLGIDSVTDFMVEQFTYMTYIPDKISIPLIVLCILSFAFGILTLIRGN